MGLKVAILGMSPSKKFAPFNTEWEIWGLPWDKEVYLKCDRLFEMHDIDALKHINGYLKDIEMLECVYMQEKYFDNVIEYPLKEVINEIGDYFTCSMAYMMGLAIQEADEISIYGVDMTDESYQHQRPNMEYLIGVARGKGIKVTIHETSPLCKYQKFADFPVRYGYI